MHSPVRWSGYDTSTSTDYEVIGSSKNVHLYISKSNYSFELTQGGGANTPEISDLSEIQSALGENGYSFTNTSLGSVEEVKSNNISESLEVGYQKIIIRTTDTANTVKDSSQKTGLAYAVANITGYLKQV